MRGMSFFQLSSKGGNEFSKRFSLTKIEKIPISGKWLYNNYNDLKTNDNDND